jgi:hypothetical protein
MPIRAPLIILLALCAAASWAAPRTPATDNEVLERVPARATDPAARDMQALRQAWRAQPQDLDTATRLAWRYQQEVAATGDPRYMGSIQAALAPWWNLPEPPADVRVLRAVVLQFDHRFEPALADLAAVLKEDPQDTRALAWQLAIRLVLADYAGARVSCEALAPLAGPLVAAGCRAQVDAATGQATAAAQALSAALQRERDADPATRLWCLTRLAEIQERRGDFASAEAAFTEAGQLGLADVYLLAAHADLLLDRGRAADVLKLLKDRGRADVLLLRLALAAQATQDSRAAAFANELFARFDAARMRGDTSHRKEEARATLALRKDPARALPLARDNWAEQREPADARVLLEVALAARDKAAAAPVMKWLADTRLESAQLSDLASRVGALP